MFPERFQAVPFPLLAAAAALLSLLWDSGDVSFRDQIIGTFRRVDFLLACFPACYFQRRLFDSFCCGLPFQIVGTDTNCFSWWSDSGTQNPSVLCPYWQVVWFHSEVRAGSSKTFPDDLPWERYESVCLPSWSWIFSNLWGNYLAPTLLLVVGSGRL